MRGPPDSQMGENVARDPVRSGMREFESSHFSQPVRRLETLPSVTSEMPANGGLLQIGCRSLDTTFGSFQDEIADSLRRIFDIFPFSGDCGWRPGSICTAWRARQCNSTLDVRIILHQNLANAEADRFAANPYQLSRPHVALFADARVGRGSARFRFSAQLVGAPP